MGASFSFFLAIHFRSYRKPGLEMLGRGLGFQSSTLGGFVLHSEVQVITSGSARASLLSSHTAALAFRLLRYLCKETHTQLFSCEALIPLDYSVWALLPEELPWTAPLPSLPIPSSVLRNYLLHDVGASFPYHCCHHIAIMTVLVESVSEPMSFRVLAHKMVTGLGQNIFFKWCQW